MIDKGRSTGASQSAEGNSHQGNTSRCLPTLREVATLREALDGSQNPDNRTPETQPRVASAAHPMHCSNPALVKTWAAHRETGPQPPPSPPYSQSASNSIPAHRHDHQMLDETNFRHWFPMSNVSVDMGDGWTVPISDDRAPTSSYRISLHHGQDPYHRRNSKTSSTGTSSSTELAAPNPSNAANQSKRASEHAVKERARRQVNNYLFETFKTIIPTRFADAMKHKVRIETLESETNTRDMAKNAQMEIAILFILAAKELCVTQYEANQYLDARVCDTMAQNAHLQEEIRCLKQSLTSGSRQLSPPEAGQAKAPDTCGCSSRPRHVGLIRELLSDQSLSQASSAIHGASNAADTTIQCGCIICGRHSVILLENNNTIPSGENLRYDQVIATLRALSLAANKNNNNNLKRPGIEMVHGLSNSKKLRTAANVYLPQATSASSASSFSRHQMLTAYDRTPLQQQQQGREPSSFFNMDSLSATSVSSEDEALHGDHHSDAYLSQAFEAYCLHDALKAGLKHGEKLREETQLRLDDIKAKAATGQYRNGAEGSGSRSQADRTGSTACGEVAVERYGVVGGKSTARLRRT
ncbi:hypothetical protein MMC25_002087 [Agyrium rufum]|nr:hypothetical protein [Agyrium rufum]